MPTLKGKAKLRIEEGTQPGKLLTYAWQRNYWSERSGEGDQYVRVNVYIPKKLTDKERSAIESLREMIILRHLTKLKRKRILFQKMKDVFGG